MIDGLNNKRLRLLQTHKFSVIELVSDDYDDTELKKFSLGCKKKKSITNLPTMDLSVLLSARPSGKTSSSVREKVSKELWDYIEKYGFLVLSVPRHSSAGRVIEEMKQSLHKDLFPDSDHGDTMRNKGDLKSGSLYISERGVPMWRVGYEECDAIREAFRVHAGSPDSQPWKNSEVRSKWIRGMFLCRDICDVALNLTLGYNPRIRYGSGLKSWYKVNSIEEVIDRDEDYSVFYAMNYFNDENSQTLRERDEIIGTDNELLNVKEHVDPSLFVLEPFLADVEGLQVQATGSNDWITCDGQSSPILDVVSLEDDNLAMVLFIGRAFARKACEMGKTKVQPTMHRVIATKSGLNKQRRTVIYEQKYGEYFPDPTLD